MMLFLWFVLDVIAIILLISGLAKPDAGVTLFKAMGLNQTVAHVHEWCIYGLIAAILGLWWIKRQAFR